QAVGAHYGRHGRVVIEGELPEGLARAYRDRLRHGTTQVTTADRVLTGDGEPVTRVQDGVERYAVGVCQRLGCRAVGARDGPQAVAADDLDRQRLELLVAGIQDQHLPRVYERAVEVVEGDDVRDAHTVGRGDVVEGVSGLHRDGVASRRDLLLATWKFEDQTRSDLVARKSVYLFQRRYVDSCSLRDAP